jgi:hypothetical protein
MIAQHVDVEIVSADSEMYLPADEREAGAELDQEPLDVIDEPHFKVSLDGGGVQGHEVEQVRVLERLLGEVAVGRGQGLRKVVDGFALALVEVGFNLNSQDGAAPAVFQRLGRVPEPLGGILDFFEKTYVVIPRYFCHRLRQNCNSSF